MRYKDKKEKGTDPSYYDTLAQVESSNNPNARAKTSSAAGLYQFTKSTWEDMTNQLGLDYTLDDRFDPEKSRQVVEAFTKRNISYLESKLGKSPNQAETYLAHFAGMGGAASLLEQVYNNPNALVTDVVSQNQINANKTVFLNKDGSPKKVRDIYNWAATKFKSPLLEETQKQQEVVTEQQPQIRETTTQAIDNTYYYQPRAPKKHSYALPEIKNEEEKQVEQVKEEVQQQKNEQDFLKEIMRLSQVQYVDPEAN